MGHRTSLYWCCLTLALGMMSLGSGCACQQTECRNDLAPQANSMTTAACPPNGDGTADDQANSIIPVESYQPGPAILGATIDEQPNPTSRYAIDLPTALRLAHAQNTQIALARERIAEAEAQLDQARILLLPTLAAGASYDHHDGRIQDVEGHVIEVSRSSGYAGLGAGAVAAGTVTVPGVSIRTDLADAIFAPLVARQNVRAREGESRTVQNNVLLDVMVAYHELLRAKAAVAIGQETYDNASELARVTENYAQSGEGLQADSERAAVERSLREKDLEQARETLRVRSAQLVELLRLDPLLELEPTDATVLPIALVPEKTSLADLVNTALWNRPELERNRALVELTCERLRQATYGPLLPSVALGYSVGAFGGGTGSSLVNTSDRSDFDAMIFWELKNLGAGDQALRRERRSQLQQAQTLEVAVMDRIAAEVNQAHAQVSSRRKQVEICQAAVQRAVQSFDLNRRRSFEMKGLPIEVLQSIQSLATARREYLAAVTDYNQAQCRLHTAIGQPVLETALADMPTLRVPVVPQPGPAAAVRLDPSR